MALEPRERAQRFIRRHPVAARAIAEAALQATRRRPDPASLVHEGAAALAKASRETGSFLGFDLSELQDLLIDVVGDLAGDLF